MTNKNLEKACRSNSLKNRQDLLCSLDLEEYVDYVSKIRYVNRNGISHSLGVDGIKAINYLAVTQPHLLARFMIPGFKSEILVPSNLFETFRENDWDYGDLVSIILDHEGYHAKRFYEWPLTGGYYGLIKYDPIILGEEIMAYENQEKNFKRRKCSKSFIDFIKNKKRIMELRLAYC